MLNQLLPIFIGFLLTTVLGGLLGFYFQNRAWKYQNNAKVLESELQTAIEVFEGFSKLMDKRLYRMRLLYWRLSSDQYEQDEIEKYMELYRGVLYEWNDNLNRNLALAQCYFGDKVRKQIDYELYSHFSNIGRSLEIAYTERKTGKLKSDLQSLDHKIEVLSDAIYRFNIQVITQIQQRRVGVFFSDKEKSSNSKNNK